MSEGFANCFCGQPRVKPPLNPSAGQTRGLAGAGACWAKLAGAMHVAAASTAAVKDAFEFTIVSSPRNSEQISTHHKTSGQRRVVRSRSDQHLVIAVREVPLL